MRVREGGGWRGNISVRNGCLGCHALSLSMPLDSPVVSPTITPFILPNQYPTSISIELPSPSPRLHGHPCFRTAQGLQLYSKGILRSTFHTPTRRVSCRKYWIGNPFRRRVAQLTLPAPCRVGDVGGIRASSWVPYPISGCT